MPWVFGQILFLLAAKGISDPNEKVMSMQYPFVKIDLSVLNQTRPFQALIHEIILVLLFVLAVGLIQMIFSLINKKIISVFINLAMCAIGLVLILVEQRLKWLSPISNAVFGWYYDGFYNKTQLSIWFSYGYFIVLNLCLTIILVRTAKKLFISHYWRYRIMDNIITVQNVALTIKKTDILKNISVEFEKGKIHGLIGRNGSGKTMLMKCICGFIKTTSGAINVDGKLVGKDVDFSKDMGIIIETLGFIPYYSGYKNLKLLAGLNNKIGKDEILKSMKQVGLEPTLKRHVKNILLVCVSD